MIVLEQINLLQMNGESCVTEIMTFLLIERELMHNKDLRQCKSREAILLSNSDQFKASRSFKFWKVGIKEACDINK